MTTFVETQKGKLRPRAIRPDRPPSPAVSALAAPFKDPATGRFMAGNPGGRLRQLRALARVTAESLLRLEPDHVAPWLRPHLSEAQAHCQRLVDALPAKTDELLSLCGDEARAGMFSVACLSQGASDDCSPAEARAWRDEGRAWMREARQVVLTRKAIARDVPVDDGGEAALPWFQGKGATK
ncbi:MAG TPA: hypothetical protein VFR23_26155 [Jiangellaceae bacterium]|nr:hypothetical protein [Jiangellaceae bacterium]